MNTILLESTILNAILHLVYYFYNKFKINIYCLGVYIGLITSLFNHGMTNIFLKILDRIFMSVMFAASLYYQHKYNDIGGMVLMLTSGGLYVTAKASGMTELHIAAHLLASFASFRIISKMEEERRNIEMHSHNRSIAV